MQISFRCPNCKTKLAIDASAAGEHVTCPQCGASVTVPHPRLGPGVTIGGFKIERLIGTGGMGEVYLARQLSMDRPVALKILSGHARSEEDKQRFIQEVRTLARLEHPNIVTAHEAGEDGGYLYLAMSYVNGEALDRRLATQGRIPEREALRIARKIARALDYAWTEHRLLHRDIKPANILIDAHGEPKLADLGLAHSVQAAEGRIEGRGRVAGTPNYMSPEQAEGRDDLDCRSDIYALGATLYHMLTGQLPYAADTPEETLRKKFEEPLPDPRSFVPDLSPSVVALLAGMLAPDREERYPTWKELIADIDRVLAGRPPLRNMSKTPSARVKVSAAELEALKESAGRRPAPVLWERLILAVVILLAIAAVAAVVYVGITRAPLPQPSSSQLPPPPQEEHRSQLAELERQYHELLQYEQAHPDDLLDLLRRWKAFAKAADRTDFGRMARDRIRKIEGQIRAEAEQVMVKLKSSVEPLVAAEKFEDACQLLTNYSGPWAEPTASLRAAEVERIRALQQEAVARAALKEKEKALAIERARREAAKLLIRPNPPGALQAYDSICQAAGLDPQSNDLAPFRNVLVAATRARELVLETFRAEIGRPVEIQLTSGSENFEITGVANGTIQVRRRVGAGFVERTIAYTELSASERLRRLERLPPPGNRILQALLLLELGNSTAARRALEPVASDPIGRYVWEAMESETQAAQETAAQRALAVILRKLNIPEGLSVAEVVQQVRRTAVPAGDVYGYRSAVREFRRLYGSTRYAVEMEPVLQAIERIGVNPREVEPAVLDRAREALRRANPSLNVPPDSVLRSTPDGLELVIEGMAGAQLTSLAPLAGLPIVRITAIAPGWKDLSLVRGIPVEELEVRGTRLENLDVLRSLPVRSLVLVRCGVESLMPVSGLQIEALDVSENRITSLMPLSGMPLKRLNISANPGIASLRPLMGMPLEELHCNGCEKIDDLRPLQGTPLRRLSIAGTLVSDLSVLGDMPLEYLDISRCRHIRDLSVLRSISSLMELRINEMGLTSLDALKGLKLNVLWADNNPELESLAPLAGMPLETLYIRGSRVRDLQPLAGMPLKRLAVARTRVSDLAPLANLRSLTFLDLADCPIEDPTPLLSLTNLTTFVVPHDRPRWREVVFRMPWLKYAGPSEAGLVRAAEFSAPATEDVPPARRPDSPGRPDRPRRPPFHEPYPDR